MFFNDFFVFSSALSHRCLESVCSHLCSFLLESMDWYFVVCLTVNSICIFYLTLFH